MKLSFNNFYYLTVKIKQIVILIIVAFGKKCLKEYTSYSCFYGNGFFFETMYKKEENLAKLSEPFQKK